MNPPDLQPPLKKPRIYKNKEKSAAARFYKTRPCSHFTRLGCCKKGSSCTFAHGDEDLRGPTSRDLYHEQTIRDGERKVYMENVCKSYINGESCVLGDNCNFLHGDFEPREVNAKTIVTDHCYAEEELVKRSSISNVNDNVYERDNDLTSIRTRYPADLLVPGIKKDRKKMPTKLNGIYADWLDDLS